jgi:tetratricopeptide (TPR) repeat protein
MCDQLDLFLHNPRVIRQNEAGERLRELDLAGALEVYADLLRELPGDPEIAGLQQTAEAWQEFLADFQESPPGPDRLHRLWVNLTPETPAPLVRGIHARLIQELERLPSPELVYCPPRFHIGVILLQEKRWAAAESWFARALAAGISERARFLAYRGAALEALGGWKRSRNSYRDAFCEDAAAVDLELLTSGQLRELLASLDGECGEFLGEGEMAAWLPVWGWLQNSFTLPEEGMAGGNWDGALEEKERSETLSPPQLWFECLRCAEYLRAVAPQHPDLVLIRQRMRRLNGQMFQLYLKKIENHHGRPGTFHQR